MFAQFEDFLVEYPISVISWPVQFKDAYLF